MSSSPLDFLLRRFAGKPDHVAMNEEDDVCCYGSLLRMIEIWQKKFVASGVGSGSVVLLKGDFRAGSVSCLLALLNIRAIVTPVSTACIEKWDEFAETGEVEFVIDHLGDERIVKTDRIACHPHYEYLRKIGCPGIVLFSSGTTGASKGVVHDANRLLGKFHARRKDFCTLAFLLFDHIGGLDTLFYCLSNTSSMVFTESRDPEAVCQLIERHRIEVLPTAPSFLNLLLISEAYERYDLSSLKVITYGAEVMLQSTLERCAVVFPDVVLMQKYGASEIGTMRSHSRSNCSRWVKIGGEGYQWRAREGKLEIKADMAMVGYLNAPSPFTEDGYFITGDCIESDGEYIRFSGRDSDIINVGGQKVFPAEVENLVKEIPDVAEVTIFGQPSPLLGNMVCCKVLPQSPSALPADIRSKIRAHLKSRIDAYKIPQKIIISHESLTTKRLKKVRL